MIENYLVKTMKALRKIEWQGVAWKAAECNK